MSTNNKGIYIVFEGLDGSGKTTLFDKLLPVFLNENIPLQSLCPTRVYSTNSILEKIYGSNKKFKRINLFRTIIFAYRSMKSSINTNWNSNLIIGDRSIVVSYVKHWRKYFDSPFLTVTLVNILEPFIHAPDYIFLLDAPEEVLFERLHKKDTLEIDETPENLRMMRMAYNEIRNSYKISRLAKTKWIDVNSNKNSDDLVLEVYIIIKDILNSSK